MASHSYRLDIRELAIEWFDLPEEVDPVTATLVSEAMGFALHCIKEMHKLREEAIEAASAEVEEITAQQMVEVVKAGRMVSPGDSICRDLWLALRYMLVRDPDSTDWEQVLEDLTQMDD